MKNIKQTLSEELNKMQFLLGYQRGRVISEQLLSEAPPGVTDTATPTTAAPKPSIRSIIEADIKKENLGLTWAQVKQEFGSTGQGSENQLLYKAWKGGWRPGKEVPAEFQTPTYKQKIVNGGTTTTTTTVAGQIAGSEQTNLLQGLTPENADVKIDELKSKAKEAKQQKRADRKTCKDFADAIDSKGLFKRINKPVADQEICDILRFCITQGLVENGRGRDFSGCDAFPAKAVQQTPDASTTTTTTVAPSPLVQGGRKTGG